jgi:SAM-dependent methyltransferase
MKSQDITTGFQAVDKGQSDFLVNFLADANQIPSVLDCLGEQLRWLAIQPGNYILDIGCGIGDQASEMAKKVGPSGKVIGTDLSETMIKISKQRHAASGLPLTFQTANATEQPFENESFDIVRTERVLMYVHDLSKAFREFNRLLKSGGKLLVFDFDWDALTISHTNKALTRKIVEFISDSFPRGRVGAELLDYFKDFAFNDIRIKAAGYTTQIEFARQVIGGTIAKGVEEGIFIEKEINEWWIHLEEKQQKGSFLISFNGFIVMGKKNYASGSGRQ